MADDILVKITAKFDTLKNAWNWADKLDKKVDVINRKVIKPKGLGNLNNDFRLLNERLGVFEQRLTRVTKGSGAAINAQVISWKRFGSSMKNVNIQLRDANELWNKTNSKIVRGTMEANRIGAAYKKLRLELEGVSATQRALKSGAPLRPIKPKTIERKERGKDYRLWKASSDDISKRTLPQSLLDKWDEELQKNKWNVRGGKKYADFRKERGLEPGSETLKEYQKAAKKHNAEEQSIRAKKEADLKKHYQNIEKETEKHIKKLLKWRQLTKDEKIKGKPGAIPLLADTKWKETLAKGEVSSKELELSLAQADLMAPYMKSGTEEMKEFVRLRVKLTERLNSLQDELNGKSIKEKDINKKITTELTKQKDLKTKGLAGPLPVREGAIPSEWKSAMESIPSFRSIAERDPGTAASIFKMGNRVAAESGGKKSPAEVIEKLTTLPVGELGKEFESFNKETKKLSSEFVELANATTQATKGIAGEGIDDQFSNLKTYPKGLPALPDVSEKSKVPKFIQQGGRKKQETFLQKALGSKTAQNFLLGGGFPLLFGGNVGAVGGSLLGSGIAASMGKPEAGFGLQIAGSAIGTIIANSISKVNELANALKELNMDKLEESGVRFTAELIKQIDLLEKQGEFQQARTLMEEQLRKQSGLGGDQYTDINNAMTVLKGSWDDVVMAAGGLLALIGTPFIVALSGINIVVSKISRGLNSWAGNIKKFFSLFKWTGLGKSWEKTVAHFDQTLVKTTKNANKLLEALNKLNEDKLADIKFKKSLSTGTSQHDELFNLSKKRDYEIEKSKESFKGKMEQYELQRDRLKYVIDNTKTKGAGKKKIADAKTTLEDLKAAIAKSGELQKETENLIKDEYTNKETAIKNEIEERITKLTAENELLSKKITLEKQILKQSEKGNDLAAAKLKIKQELNKLDFDTEEQLKDLDDTDDAKLIDAINTSKDLKKKLIELTGTYGLKDSPEKQLDALYQQIGQTIKDGIVDSLYQAVEATRSLGDIASSVFRTIARSLLSYGVTSLLPESWKNSRLFGGVRASGGPVKSGKSYLVGEEGPELFVPSSQGNIVSNKSLGGSTNVVVNVEASGSPGIQGNDNSSMQLGRLIGEAVQQEIVTQQRPGGLLSR